MTRQHSRPWSNVELEIIKFYWLNCSRSFFCFVNSCDQVDDCCSVHLFSEGPAGCLGVSSQHTGFHILWFEVLFNLVCPQSSSCSHLCYFHIKIHSNSPEEGQPWGKVVDVETSLKTCSRWKKISIKPQNQSE